MPPPGSPRWAPSAPRRERALLTSLAWRLRSRLTANGRARIRWAVDPVLSSVGSISGTAGASRLVALTFDDGPDPVVTPKLLDLLHERGVRATFFVLTDPALRHPELVRRIVDEGHELALHADRHERLTRVSFLELRRRLVAARKLLQEVSHARVRFFRPPFGAQSLPSYLAARASGLDVVVWGPHAEDWVQAAPEVVAARGLTRVQSGEVLLLHDGVVTPRGEPTPTFDRVRAFELILEGLAVRGLTPTTVGALLAAEPARRTAWFRP
jgi:peptidoglycan/xylan/chitin deacetylase (PgdA/CDA1 family)